MQQASDVWEFSSASDHDDVEAEEAVLQQHLLALVTQHLFHIGLRASLQGCMNQRHSGSNDLNISQAYASAD